MSDDEKFDLVAELRYLGKRFDDDLKHRDEFRADIKQQIEEVSKDIKELHKHRTTCVIIENDMKIIKGQVKTIWAFISGLILAGFSAVVNWIAKR